MAVWYAQAGSCNIDQVSGGTTSNVWNSAQDGSGSWMDTSVLTSGTAGTILAANGQVAIAVNIDINLSATGRLSTAVETGSTAGGGFTVANARTITGGMTAGTTDCLTTSGTGYTLTLGGGTVTGSSTTASKYGINFATNCALAGTATVNGGANGHGINYGTTSNGALTGNVTGGSGTGIYGVNLGSNGNLALTGNVTGGSGLLAFGIRSQGLGAPTVVGNLIDTPTAVAVAGKCYWNPGATNYHQMQYDSTAGHVYKYGKTIPTADVRSGVNGDGANAPATGTLVPFSDATEQYGIW